MLFELAHSLASLGRVQRMTGRPADALESFGRAVAALERWDTPPPVAIYSLACYRALIAGLPPGDPAEAGRAMKDLRRSLAAGFGNLAKFREDTDLDSLRGRDDFRLLLLDIAMPADPFQAQRTR